MKKISKILLIVVGVFIIIPIIYFVFIVGVVSFGKKTEAGVKITSDKVIDTNWGFSFSNTYPELKQESNNVDNNCNVKDCREFNGIFKYKVYETKPSDYKFSPPYSLTTDARIVIDYYDSKTDKNVIEAIEPDSVNLNGVSKYNINDSSCFLNKERNYTVCFTLGSKESFLQNNLIGSYDEFTKVFQSAVDSFSFDY